MEACWTLKEVCEEKAKKPHSRKGHMALRVRGQIVLFGGEDVETDNTDDTVEHNTVNMFSMRVIWLYHLDIDRWTKTVLPHTQVIPPPTAEACAVAIGSHIYQHGGSLGPQSLLGTQRTEETGALWKLTSIAEGISWSEIKFQDKKSMPSPRCLHAGWEYADKLWIFGGEGFNPKNYMFNDDEIFESYGNDGDDGSGDDNDKEIISYNDQLACYNPSNQKWIQAWQFGAIPSPRSGHAVAKIKEHIWLCGGQMADEIYDDLYELSMKSLTWTLIEPVSKLTYSARTGHTFTAISDHQIALYGGARVEDDTSLWFLELETLSWKECETSYFDFTDDYGRERHTATVGAESLIIFGGNSYISEDESTCTIDMLQWTLAPKSLVKSAVESAYKNRSVSQEAWKTLPRHFYHQLHAMDEIDAADDSNRDDEEDCDESIDVHDGAADRMIWNFMTETLLTYTRKEMIDLVSMVI